MQETLIPSLGPEDQEDPLEEEMTTHSSILAWRIPWRILGGILAGDTLHEVTKSWIL